MRNTVYSGLFFLVIVLVVSALVIANDASDQPDKIRIIGMTMAGDDVVLSIQCPPGFDSAIELFACDGIAGSTWKVEPTDVSIDDQGIMHCTVESSGSVGMEYFIAANADLDSDRDGVSDARELFVHGTMILDADSDNDTFTDGFETDYGMDPNSSNAVDGDLDNDGLSNHEERCNGTDPTNRDTDGDKISDKRELDGFGDPTDGSDMGGVFVPGGWVAIELAVGDDSNSASERYELRVGDRIRHQSVSFSGVYTNTYNFKSGEAYPFEIKWLETDYTRGKYDYDYTATIGGLPASNSTYHGDWLYGPGFLIHDPYRILGVHEDTIETRIPNAFPQAGMTGTLYVLKFDLDIDSDNNNGISAPDHGLAEEYFEAQTNDDFYGKFVFINQNDDDKDGVPDYSDVDNSEEGQFVPLTLELKPNIDWYKAKIEFSYDGEDSLPSLSDFEGTNIGNGYFDYTGVKKGKIRIWKDCKPGDKRDALDYLLNNIEYTASTLGFSDSVNRKTFYVEGLNPVERSLITATLKMDYTVLCADTVVVTVVDVNLGVNCNNSGGMRVGVPDVEFIIDENDDIIEDQKNGFEFWWGRDEDPDKISWLGLVDLAPFLVNIPDVLLDGGYKFYLMLETGGKDEGMRVDVCSAAGSDKSFGRRGFVRDLEVASEQVFLGFESFTVSATPQSITVDQSANEFLFRARQGSLVKAQCWLSLLAEAPNDKNHSRVRVDSVKLMFRETKQFYTTVTSRNDNWMNWPYYIDSNYDGSPVTQTIRRYGWPELVPNCGIVDKDKSQYLIHVHGFHVDWPDGAHEEFGEMFRRLYWMGYRGNFIGFTWEGDEGFEPLKFNEQQENAFQTAPCFLNFLDDMVYREWGAKTENVKLFAHSLGNQVVLDAMRLRQTAKKGEILADSVTCIEPAVNGETFWLEKSFAYAGDNPITYSVEDLKRMSWAFYFNQKDHRAFDSVNNAIHSYNPGDYALVIMMIGDKLFTKMNSFDKTIPGFGVRLVPTSNRAPYSRLDSDGASLAYDVSMMLRYDKRDSSYGPTSYVAPLGRDHNTCASQGSNIDASKFGWRFASHGGFKGKREFIFGLYGSIWSGETPLPLIWGWFEQIQDRKGLKTGKE